MKTSTADKYLKLYERERVKIEAKLAGVFKEREPKSIYKPCAYGVGSGGKRLRPFLVLLSARAVGGKFSRAYNAALAVEVFHNFTLVHDDIMDNAVTRRNLPALHAKYDVNTAILAGDNMLGVSYSLLLKDCKSNAHQVVSSLTNAMVEVCEGQALDKEFETRKNVSLEQYKTMIGKKTAALAEVCCEIGGIIGGGTPAQIKALKKFGRNLGLAFQIQDDLLDIFADDKKFGKAIGGDLVEGKKTFLFLSALNSAKGNNKKLLKAVVENKGIRKNQINKYKRIYDDLGVIETTAREVEKYTKSALKALSTVGDEEQTAALNWLANMLIKRSY